MPPRSQHEKPDSCGRTASARRGAGGRRCRRTWYRPGSKASCWCAPRRPWTPTSAHRDGRPRPDRGWVPPDRRHRPARRGRLSLPRPAEPGPDPAPWSADPPGGAGARAWRTSGGGRGGGVRSTRGRATQDIVAVCELVAGCDGPGGAELVRLLTPLAQTSNRASRVLPQLPRNDVGKVLRRNCAAAAPAAALCPLLRRRYRPVRRVGSAADRAGRRMALPRGCWTARGGGCGRRPKRRGTRPRALPRTGAGLGPRSEIRGATTDPATATGPVRRASSRCRRVR